jgi:hypothetical protein
MKMNFLAFGISLLVLIIFASGISEVFSLQNDQKSGILLVGPNFSNVKVSNLDHVFKFLYEVKNGSVVSMDVLNDESTILLVVNGTNIELKLNIPRNFPISDYPEDNSKTPIVLVDNVEITYHVSELDCFYEYTINASNPSQIKFIFSMTYANSLGGTIEKVPEDCFKKTRQELDSLSPLKQFKIGILDNEIQCKESLIFITKYDGSPACVTPETKQKLIERGWATFS